MTTISGSTDGEPLYVPCSECPAWLPPNHAPQKWSENEAPQIAQVCRDCWVKKVIKRWGVVRQGAPCDFCGHDTGLVGNEYQLSGHAYGVEPDCKEPFYQWVQEVTPQWQAATKAAAEVKAKKDDEERRQAEDARSRQIADAAAERLHLAEVDKQERIDRLAVEAAKLNASLVVPPPSATDTQAEEQRIEALLQDYGVLIQQSIQEWGGKLTVEQLCEDHSITQRTFERQISGIGWPKLRLRAQSWRKTGGQ